MNFHGGNVHSYNRRLLDFSSNINPAGVPESFRTALQNNMEEFTRYPDIRYLELRKAIGEYYGVEDISCIVPGNGAVEVLFRAIQQSGKRRLISLRPTFSEYSRAALQLGMEYQAVDAFDSRYQTVDAEKILKAADGECAFILCNPNNPTGTLVNKEKLLMLAEGLKAKGALFIIDEAFMEFAADYPHSSMLNQLENFDHLLIVKAATKFFGMPGIRLGYGISHNLQLINKIRESMEPWNINTAAVIAGLTVLKDSAYIKKTRAWIDAERMYIYNELSKLKHIEVYHSAANFHLIKLLDSGLDTWQLKEMLLRKDILIRTPEGFDGLDGRYARLAVKDRQSNAALMKSLQEAFSENII